MVMIGSHLRCLRCGDIRRAWLPHNCRRYLVVDIWYKNKTAAIYDGHWTSASPGITGPIDVVKKYATHADRGTELRDGPRVICARWVEFP